MTGAAGGKDGAAGGKDGAAGGKDGAAAGKDGTAGGENRAPDGMIEAAGGVVLRTEGDEPEVLIVHRVRHEDWSLPKGKLDPGERAEDAAVREVEEETGVLAELSEELPDLHYEVAQGPKHVRWFRMTPLSGDPRDRQPDDEVDVARWVPADEAFRLLTYDHDVSLLRHTLAGDRT